MLHGLAWKMADD